MTLTTAPAFAPLGAGGTESICIVRWNGLPSAELAGSNALHRGVAEQVPPQVVYATP